MTKKYIDSRTQSKKRTGSDQTKHPIPHYYGRHGHLFLRFGHFHSNGFVKYETGVNCTIQNHPHPTQRIKQAL